MVYKLKALSICINGQVFRKGENEPKGGFTEKRFDAKTLKEAEAAGFLEKVKIDSEPKPKPKAEPKKKDEPKPKNKKK